LSGTGLQAGLQVRFASVAATVTATAQDGTWAQVETPPGAAGPASVEATGPSGSSVLKVGGFVYVAPLSIVSATPNRGPTSGGTRVRIQGTGFAPSGTVQVAFAGVPGLQTR
jgi:hypothetical protein